MASRVDAPSNLVHVMVVGGSLRDWSGCDGSQWERWAGDLAAVAASSGVRWLTITPYEADDATGAPDRRREVATDGTPCTVIIDPIGDGRARFAAAMNDLDPDGVVDEQTVAAALYAPAEAEPDLVVVAGPSDRLPPSLVWELAYAELVFVDQGWSTLGAHHVDDAIREFSRRHRRFGGLGS